MTKLTRPPLAVPLAIAAAVLGLWLTPTHAAKSGGNGDADRPSSTPKRTSTAKKPGSSTSKPAATPSSKKATASINEESGAPKATPSTAKKPKATATEDDVPKATPKPGATPPAASTHRKKSYGGSDDDAPAAAEEKGKKVGAGDTPEAAIPEVPAGNQAPPASIESSQLKEFEEQPEAVKALIEDALALTKLNLTYKFGSDDPAQGGMDCSGTIYYLLRHHGLKDVPRDASGQYVWARKNGKFFAVNSKKAGGFEFSDLLPGDLMFWSGTYQADRDPPITHSMMYLGVEKKRKQQVMFGSSDGRTYDGKQRFGVSVFDFRMPKTPGTTATGPGAVFLGYARIPGLREPASPAATAETKEPEKEREKEKDSPEAGEKKKPAATPGKGTRTQRRPRA